MNVKETRKLFLEDAVERARTGNSPLREWKAKAKRFYLLKRMYWAAMIGCVVSLGFVINKRHTGRMTSYLIPFVGLVGLSMITRSYFNSYVEEIKKASGIENYSDIEKGMYFHKYSLLY
jgi:hypothetical protein